MGVKLGTEVWTLLNNSVMTRHIVLYLISPGPLNWIMRRLSRCGFKTNIFINTKNLVFDFLLLLI